MNIVEIIQGELKTWSNDVVGLDIETYSIKNKDAWNVTPFEIGLYSKTKGKKIRLLINPYFFDNIDNSNRSIMRFYKPLLYRTLTGQLLSLDDVRNILNTVNFKTVYGHNLMDFDLKHLKSYGINIKAKRFIDTYLLAGQYLPLKYYFTLQDWHQKFKDKYGYKFFTEKGNVKLSAEAIHCFITNNPHFSEAHTAVEDCIIEAKIYDYAIKRGVKTHTAKNWVGILKEYFNRFKYFKTVEV